MSARGGTKRDLRRVIEEKDRAIADLQAEIARLRAQINEMGDAGIQLLVETIR